LVLVLFILLDDFFSAFVSIISMSKSLEAMSVCCCDGGEGSGGLVVVLRGFVTIDADCGF
jgi:hypothetical protein